MKKKKLKNLDNEIIIYNKDNKKLSLEFDLLNHFGLALIVGNSQPKKEYKNSDYGILLFILLFAITIRFQHEYKK